jgi:hypothetical protein
MSGGAEHYVPRSTAAALDRLRAQDTSPVLIFGRVLEIAFPASATRRDVQHGLGVIPTGFVVIATQGGNVQSFDLANWTAELAFLSADAANTRVRGYFVVTEVPTDA